MTGDIRVSLIYRKINGSLLRIITTMIEFAGEGHLDRLIIII